MKEFQDLISELHNGVEDLAEHVSVPRSSMPPNILILRRKTVRQFPDGVMVALYYNDKLGLQFSIPYGGEPQSVVTPVALKEEQLDELSKKTLRSYVVGAAKSKDLLALKASNMRQVGADKKSDKLQEKSWKRTKGIERAVGQMNEDWTQAKEGVIARLRNIRDFHSIKHVRHADGTKTHVDPTTAHALLTVHDALKPEHQEKFAQHLEHSKPKFHKMLDFTWTQVK